MERVTIREAALRLRLSTSSIRQCIQTGGVMPSDNLSGKGN